MDCFAASLTAHRGVVLEWLETLDYGADSRGFKFGLNQPETETLPLTMQLFSNQGGIKQQKEGNGLRLSYIVSKMLWALIKHRS